MLEIRQNGRGMVAILMIMLLLCTLIPETAHAALSAGKSGKAVFEYLGKGKDGEYYYDKANDEQLPKFQVKIGGTDYTGYCMNNGKGFYDGQTYTSKAYGSARDWTALSAARQRTLTLIMVYGYNKGKSAPYGNVNDYFAATQTLVWEASEGKETVSTSGEWTSKANSYDDMISGKSYGEKNYKWIKDKITAHLKGASFTTKKSAAAKTYTMKYHYGTKTFSTVLNDTNAGNTYKKSDFTSGLSMNRSSYQYTFSASKAGTYSAALKNDISTGTSQPMLVLQPTATEEQSILLGATDTTEYHVKFKTESAGTAQIKKTSDNGVVSGFTFNVKCAANGYNANHTTGASGIITLNLYPGTYTITEMLTPEQKAAGYKEAAPVTATITANQTISVPVHNKYEPEKNEVKIIKKAADGGPVEGFRFKIKGVGNDYRKVTSEEILRLAAPQVRDNTANDPVTWKPDTDSEGIIEQINADAAEGETGEYELIYKADEKFRIRVKLILENAANASSAGEEKTDDSGKVTYRDVTWAGAATTTYDGEGVTDSNGCIVKEGLDSGTYVVTELLTEEQSLRYHEPQSQRVTLSGNGETGTVHFENQPKQTPVAIKKSCSDGNISGIEFTITGKTAWGEEIAPIVKKTDDNGYIDQLLCPGTYSIEETGLNPDIYIEQEPKVITLTGDEKEAVEVAFENIPYTETLVPEINTMARDGENGTQISEADSSVKIIDTVEYRNVLAGEKYLLRASLMKKDGMPVLDSSGEAVTADLVFVPSESGGTVDVALPQFDGTQLAEQQVVIFENLYQHESGELLVEHTDLDNQQQTIFLKKKEEPPTPVKKEPAKPIETGDSRHRIYLWVLLMTTSGAAILCFVALRGGASQRKPVPEQRRRR